MKPASSPLLSIAIPAYGRPRELDYCLQRFISQIGERYARDVEILVSDDASPGDTLHGVQDLARRYPFIVYRRYPQNIGLERNLIACADGCRGRYLWIFGDDDFLEPPNALDEIIAALRQDKHEVYVLNRTRRSFDLSKLITDNWMRLDPGKRYEFSGLREFCRVHGFISTIGFISVNIFRREAFQRVDAGRYFGTMYPQLGAMLEAFHDRSTVLIGRPLICHRTQTAEEKRAALGSKKTEADFMADISRRNAIYFSHPYVAMLENLVQIGAFSVEDILRIPENTVINGLLIDFLIQTVTLSHELSLESRPEVWKGTARFFRALPLDLERRRRIEAVLTMHTEGGAIRPAPLGTFQGGRRETLTISVVSPSFNQGRFLRESLQSVRDQTYRPIEHLVFDPGSSDGSRAIARAFPHVTLVAEPDEGQSDALNKGFQRVRGDIVAWLNSDDCFSSPRVFERIVERFLQPDCPDIVYGKGVYIDETGKKLRDVYINKDPASLPRRLQQEDGILQPALFMRRHVIEKIGLLRKDLHYSMDYEYWIRCVKAGIKFAYMDEDLVRARYHSANKTYGMRGHSYAEVCAMMKEHFGYVSHIWIRRYAEFLADGHDGVLATSASSGTRNPSKFEAHYRELLSAYNTDYDTYALLSANASQPGYGDTWREMKSLGIAPITPCKPIPLDRAQEPGHICYSVGNRRWAFGAKWKEAEIAKAHGFLRERIALRKNDECVIVGNGPSLNRTNLSLLKGRDVIVSNNAFLSKELMEHATYFTVVNYLVAEQSSHQINRLQGLHKVLPYWLSYCLNPGEDTYFVDAVGHAEFSRDMFKNMSWRHTVTFFNLHLAYGLGYRRVVLIGLDHNYVQPQGVVEQEVIQSQAADENHFHPDYFRGKKWQAADVAMMEEMYRLARIAFEEDGREIVNATVGGKLELFPRMPLGQALRIEQTEGESGIRPSEVVAEREGPLLIGPVPRSDCAHFDETEAISRLFTGALAGGTMVDVGAHHGSALAHFLDKEWKVLAFEPDENNRRQLEKRLARHANARLVTLDTRAVSNEIRKAVAFYASEVSTGISGLSAFHASHHKTQEVDTVTLREALAGRDVTAVDFLKIDTEGHDLFVLQGFPWERFRPAVVECEFEDAKTVPLGYTYRDLAKLLVDKGYTVYVSEWHPVIRYGIRHDWKSLARYPCELSDEKAWGNLLAFREPIDENALLAAVQEVLHVGAASSMRWRSRTLVILGNGPSLKGFDFKRFRGFDAIGMNAAYRYWDQIGWYPRYYICLDKVVGLSHKDQITRLIRERAANGIECFMLRRNLIEELPPEIASLDCVLDFDKLMLDSDLLAVTPLTTGSHAALFGCLLGYDRMVLMGIDGDYVERVPGAQGKGGSVLEMTETPAENPNYFFAGYQVAGDRFNVPNPVPDLHVNSWRAVAPVLAARGVKVWNGGIRSSVDAFPKRDFTEIENEEAALPMTQGGRKDAGISGGRGLRGLGGDAQWTSYAWECTGLRAVAQIPGRRKRDVLIVVACRSGLLKDRLAGLHVEVNGRRVDHELHRDIQPGCIVVRVPGKSDVTYGAIEIALVLPASSSPSGMAGGDAGGNELKQLVSSALVAVVPAEPSLRETFPTSGIDSVLRRLGLLGRDSRGQFPLSHFDGIAYLEGNPDVAAGVVAGRVSSGLEHYRRYGSGENRRYELATARRANGGSLSDIFDGAAYLQAHHDVADAVRSGAVPSALDHYVANGRKEERKVFTRFDGAALRGSQVDLARLEAARDARIELNSVKSQLNQEVNKANRSIAQLQSRVATLGFQLEAVSREAATSTAGLKAQLEAASRQAAAQSRLLAEHSRAGSLNALGYQSHPRALARTHGSRLMDHWAPLLGLSLKQKEPYYLAHRVWSLENACVGRLATSVEDMLLRILVARSIKSKTLRVLEIGTLFGIGLGIMHEALSPHFEQVHFTAIDPLDGFYGQGNLDLLTGVPVTRSVFDDNQRRMGVGGNVLTLIQRVSTEAEAVKEAARSSYDVLVVDGDHGYAGVKHDGETYIGMVKPGGYVLFDDYGNEYWPDVKRYVDTEVMGHKALKFIGAEWHTAVFQVVAADGKR